MLRFDILGLVDILSATLILFTTSALPDAFLHYHAGFLYFKGIYSFLQPNFIPWPPLNLLGSMADILSAAILFTGNPAVLVDYKNWIAAVLFLKGLWGMSTILNYLA